MSYLKYTDKLEKSLYTTQPYVVGVNCSTQTSATLCPLSANQTQSLQAYTGLRRGLIRQDEGNRSCESTKGVQGSRPDRSHNWWINNKDKHESSSGSIYLLLSEV